MRIKQGVYGQERRNTKMLDVDLIMLAAEHHHTSRSVRLSGSFEKPSTGNEKALKTVKCHVDDHSTSPALQTWMRRLFGIH